MIVALDTTVLSLFLHESAKPRSNPATGAPATYASQRIDTMIDQHSRAGDTVVIPSPCLSELLVVVPDVAKVLKHIEGATTLQIEAFGARAAVELADLNRTAIATGDKKGGSGESWQKVKFDRQIVAIAKVAGAEVLYTDDDNQTKFAEAAGLRVIHTWDLELSDQHAQLNLIDS